MNTSISIITPAYNAAEFLRPLRDSLIAQDLPELEWIVVDDGSDDGSAELLQQLQSEGGIDLKVLRNPRKGACAARNHGLHNSSGQWVKFLDADDLLASGHLRAFLPAMPALDQPLPFLVGNTRERYDTAGAEPRYRDIPVPADNATDTLRKLCRTPSFHHSACLFPREMIGPADLWNESLLADQDGNFLIRLLVNGARIRIVHTPPFIYRQHNSPGRITAGGSLKKMESRIESLRHIEACMRERGILESYRESLAQCYERLATRCAREYPQVMKQALQLAKAQYPRYRSSQPPHRRITQKLIGLRASTLLWNRLSSLRRE